MTMAGGEGREAMAHLCPASPVPSTLYGHSAGLEPSGAVMRSQRDGVRS